MSRGITILAFWKAGLILLGTMLQAPAGAEERLSNGYTQHPEAFFRAGFWFDPADPGWGLDLHMSGDRLVGAWATYDASGAPVWYLGIATERDDAWIMPLERYARSQAGVTGETVGQIVLRFTDGYHATMTWDLDGTSGQSSIEPLVVRNDPIAEDRTGFWYETDKPGYGMSVVTQGELLMTVLYLYDGAGAPRWVWADNIGSDDPRRLQAIRFTGACPGCSTGPVTSAGAGSVAVAFASENHGFLHTDVELDDGSRWRINDAQIAILSERASGREEPFALAPFSGPETLESYLETGLLNPQSYRYAPDVNFSPAPVTGLTEGGTSSTNLQEAGVDEADVVKTDGEHVYAAVDDPNGRSAPRVRVARIERGAMPAFTPLVEVAVGDPGDQIAGMYLVTERDGGRPDLLVVTLGGTQYHSFDAWFAPQVWYSSDSALVFFDVSEPSQPVRMATVEIDGGLVETRRIGEQLYHVSRYQPALTQGLPSDEAARVLREEGLEALLPQLTIDGQARSLVDPESTLLPPQPPGFRYTDLITLSAFSLEDPTSAPSTITYSGFAEAVYVSVNNLFIASSRYASSVDPGFDVLHHPDELFTDIHQFALLPDGPEYRGSGAVEGFVAWGGTSPSFSFSEFEDHLRVVTSSGQWRHGEHRVSVLSLPSDTQRNLRVVGFAPNDGQPQRLGKPGELLYGLRFLEDRLYAITFKSIDPLYVVDLARPQQPKILGELEITGFSDYLHPLSGGLLLGFGKEAVPADGPADGNFAWYQGLQLSLFDVRDPTSPALIRRIDLGRRGSESPLLSDHHAFAFLPPDAAMSRPGRVAIPVVIHDADSPSGVSMDPTQHYPWQLTGLAMFDVRGLAGGTADLVLRQVAKSNTARSDPDRHSYLDAAGTAARSILDPDNAYFYMRGELFATPWGVDQLIGPF